jgi:hypothetical protein
MGCFGIVYSVTIEVMQKYWLKENRKIYSLPEVLEMLKPNPDNPDNLPDLLTKRNVEILVHPYPLGKDSEDVIEFSPKKIEKIYPNIKCLITEREIHEDPGGIFSHSSGHRDIFSGIVQQFGVTFKATVAALNRLPLMIPSAINLSLSTLEDKDYIDVSHNVYVLGLDGDAGFACEIAYPLSRDNDPKYTDEIIPQVINRILTTAQKARLNGFQYQTSAFSLRFVNSSPSYMSMMHGRKSLLVEYDMITGTLGGYEVMKRFESEMFDLGARIHWGLDWNWVQSGQDLEGLYPKFKDWKKYFNNFNARGTWHSSFTNRLGLWKYDFKGLGGVEE